MTTISRTYKGLEYLIDEIVKRPQTITRVSFWKIPHDTPREDICLKIGRYKRDGKTLEATSPKSELTLDNEEFQALIGFLSDNYEPFKKGVKKYLPLDERFDDANIGHIKAIFVNPNKQQVLKFVIDNDILPEDLVAGVQHQVRVNAVKKFRRMLKSNLLEQDWQVWFKENDWVLGTEFVKILDEREIDTANITDYLMQAYDGFLDIVEIKRPNGDLKFWSDIQDHGNYIPSTDLIKAIIQATKYIYEVEREANSVKFLKRVKEVKTIKPRCVLIFGRSDKWNTDQKEAYRILNSSYHNLTILTYDHVLNRANRMLGVNNSETPTDEEDKIPL